MLIIKSSNLPLPRLIYLNVEMFPVLLSPVNSPFPPQSRLSASDLPSGRWISCFVISFETLCRAPCHRGGPFPGQVSHDSCCSLWASCGHRQSTWGACHRQGVCHPPGLCCGPVRGESALMSEGPELKSQPCHLPSAGPQTSLLFSLNPSGHFCKNWVNIKQR